MRYQLILLLAAAACLAPDLGAKDKPGKHEKHEKHELNPAIGDREAHADAPRHGFGKDERAVLETYFRENPAARKQLPPGLAKKNKLPPGWQKKVARGEVIPDDVWQHRVLLPPDVVRRLPPSPPGTVTVRVDDKIVRVVEDTRAVLDILGLPSF